MSGTRQYKKAWEKDHQWLELKDNSCFCKLCHCTISKFKKHNLVTHEKSEKHKKNEKSLKTTKSALHFFHKEIPNESLQIFDIKFSVSMACHCSIRSVDHLTDIIKEHARGSNLEKLKLHRTKCTCIIKNVVNVALREKLVNDLKNVKYSLLIDESTDIASTKLLCLCVKYFSYESNNIKTEFLGIIPVISTTGENLFNEIENYLRTYNIDLKDCIGFSSDGANNVCGAYNSVLSRLKEKNQNLIFIKCTCHSLALCCEYANKKLPSNIDFLISEIARWFKFSSLRQAQFKNIFLLLNEGCVDPTKFISPCNTRWLVKGKCIYVILSQWEELKSYFNFLVDTERNYHARIISEMLLDFTNYLYLTFILPIIQDFESVNASFQATNADPCKVFADLDILHQSLKQKIKTKSLGAKFELCLKESNLTEIDKQTVKARCINFLLEASEQLEKRRTDETNIFKSVRLLQPKEILCQIRTKLQDFPKSFVEFAKNEDMSKLESQYENIIFVNWKDEFQTHEIPSNSIEFWTKVRNYENALGIKCFKELAEISLAAFSLPVSNAFVERVFSFVTNVKSKQRNKINVSTLESILRIKSNLTVNNLCCKDFKVTKNMLSLFTKDIYKQRDDEKQCTPITSSMLQQLPSTSTEPSSDNTEGSDPEFECITSIAF